MLNYRKIRKNVFHFRFAQADVIISCPVQATVSADYLLNYLLHMIRYVLY